MESNPLTPSDAQRSGPTKERRRRTYLVIGAVVVGAVLLTTIGWPGGFVFNHQILEAGDYLEYDGFGSLNGTSFTSSNNFSIDAASESGISFMMIGHNPPVPTGALPEYGHDFRPYTGGPDYGEPIGTKEISTPFGTKCVKMMYRYYSGNDETIVYDMGLDSHLVYKWTVTSASGVYNYTIELSATNNTRISSADTVMRPLEIQVLNTPSSKPGTSYTFGSYPPGTGSAFCSGSVEIGQGEQFHYIIGGTNTTMYVFSFSDLETMETTGSFSYTSSLSRQPGDPGETNVTAEPGIYWFVVLYPGSDTNVTFHGSDPATYYEEYECGGYFIPYFGPKGQDH